MARASGLIRVHPWLKQKKVMALKFKFKSREEIPAEHVNLYVEREGAFVLDAEGVVEKTRVEELRSKVEEFRSSNVALTNENKELKQRFEGFDPEEVKRLGEEKRKLEEEQRFKEGKFAEVLETRLKSAKADWEKQLTSVTGERDALNARLTTIQIDQAVVGEATKRGLRPTALPDITARARMVFRLVNGVPQAFEADGQTARVGKDGLTPMTLGEWVDALVSDAPHLFESNAGGGAAGGSAGGAGAAGGGRVTKNPFRKETWNVTEQMKLQKSDPALAARLKAAA
jgi:hypothetical protein